MIDYSGEINIELVCSKCYKQVNSSFNYTDLQDCTLNKLIEELIERHNFYDYSLCTRCSDGER